VKFALHLYMMTQEIVNYMLVIQFTRNLLSSRLAELDFVRLTQNQTFQSE